MKPQFISLILSTVVLAGCDPELCEESSFVPDETARLTVQTYNAGLGPGLVRYTSLRTPDVIDAVTRESFDLLCLQEVWLQKDSDDIAQRFLDMGYHVLRADTRGMNENPEDRCEPGQLDKVNACVQRECAGWREEDVTLCGLKKCTDPLRDLLRINPRCVICAATSTGKTTEEIERICTTTGSSRIHGGGNGVILVSKYPLLETETLYLEASFANRVAQMARIVLPTGPAELACTHISANQALPPLQSRYDWWTDEKQGQVRAISDRLRERAGCVPQIFLGDFNTSTSNGDLVATSESVYDLIVSEGFVSPAADWSPPVCSSCAENTFKSDDGDSRLIDHVTYRTGNVTDFEALDVERRLDEVITVDNDGTDLETSLSDHFGIRLDFSISTE